MRLERREALERAAGDGVPLHIADPALVLALGARPVGSAGARPEAPVPGKRQELGVERDLARRRRRGGSRARGRCRTGPRSSPRRSAGTCSPAPPASSPGARCGTPAHASGARSPASPRTGTPSSQGPRSRCAARRSRSAAGGPAASRTVSSPGPRLASSRRSGATSRSTVRRLSAIPFSASSSCRTTSALPPCRRKRSASHSSRPASARGRPTGRR